MQDCSYRPRRGRKSKLPEEKANSKIRITQNSFTRWRRIKEEMGFKFDDELAAYLLSIVDTSPLTADVPSMSPDERSEDDDVDMADVSISNPVSLLLACQGEKDKPRHDTSSERTAGNVVEDCPAATTTTNDIQITGIKGNTCSELGMNRPNGDVVCLQKTNSVDPLKCADGAEPNRSELSPENDGASSRNVVQVPGVDDLNESETLNSKCISRTTPSSNEVFETLPSSAASPADSPSASASEIVCSNDMNEKGSNAVSEDSMTAETDPNADGSRKGMSGSEADCAVADVVAGMSAETRDSLSKNSPPPHSEIVGNVCENAVQPTVSLLAEHSASNENSKSPVEIELQDSAGGTAPADDDQSVLSVSNKQAEGIVVRAPDTPETNSGVVCDASKDVEMAEASSHASEGPNLNEESGGMCLQIESVCSLAPGTMCVDFNEPEKEDTAASSEIAYVQLSPVARCPYEKKASDEAEAAVAGLERASASPEAVRPVPDDCVDLNKNDSGDKDVDDCIILNEVSDNQNRSALKNALAKQSSKNVLTTHELEKISKEIAAVTSSLTVKLPSAERKKKDDDKEGNKANVKLRILERSDFLGTCQEAVGVSCKVRFSSRGVSGSVAMYFCNFCNYSSANRNMFVSHVVKHLFLCNKCTFQSVTRLGLLKHVMSHEDAKLDDYNIVALSQVEHYVDEVNELTKKKILLAPPTEKEAILEFGKGKRYFCTLCDFRSNTLHAVERHILVHVGCWVCPACFFKFEQFTQAVTHLVNAHGGIEKKLMNRVVKGSAEDSSNAAKTVKHRLMPVSVVTDPIDVSEYYYDITIAFLYLLVLPDFHIPLISGTDMEKNSNEELRKSHQTIVSSSRYVLGRSDSDSTPWSCNMCSFASQFAPHVAYHSIMCHPAASPIIKQTSTGSLFTLCISDKLKQKYLHLIDLMSDRNKAVVTAQKRQERLERREQKQQQKSGKEPRKKQDKDKSGHESSQPKTLSNLLKNGVSSASPMPVPIAPAISVIPTGPVTTSTIPSGAKQIFLPSNMPIRPNTLIKTPDGYFMLQPSSSIATPVVLPPGTAPNMLSLPTLGMTGLTTATSTSASKTVASILDQTKTLTSVGQGASISKTVPTAPVTSSVVVCTASVTPSIAVCTAPSALQTIYPTSTTTAISTSVTSTTSGNKSFYRLSPGTNVSFSSGKNKFTLINKSGQLYLQPMDDNPNSPLLPVKVNADGNFQVMSSKGTTGLTATSSGVPLTARLNAPSVPTTSSRSCPTATSLLSVSSVASSTTTATSASTASSTLAPNLPVTPTNIKKEQVESCTTTSVSTTALSSSASGGIPTYARVIGSASTDSGTTTLVISGRTICGTNTTTTTSLLGPQVQGSGTFRVLSTTSTTPTTVTPGGHQFIIMRSVSTTGTTQGLRTQTSQGVTTIVYRRGENGQLIPTTTTCITTPATTTVSTSKPDEPKHIYVTIERYSKVIYHGSLSKFSCNFCDFKTGDRKDMQVHIGKHYGKRWYRCPFCQYENATRRLILFHIHEMHRNMRMGHIPTVSFEGDDESNNCPFCDFTANSMELIVEHISSEHPDPETDINAALMQEDEGDELTGPPTGCPWYQCQHCEFSNADLYCLKCHIVQEHEGRELIGVNLLTSHDESQDLVFMCSNKCCLFNTTEYDELVSHSEHCVIAVEDDNQGEGEKDKEVPEKDVSGTEQFDKETMEESTTVSEPSQKKTPTTRRKRRSSTWGPKSKRRKVRRVSSSEEEPPPPEDPEVESQAPEKDSEVTPPSPEKDPEVACPSPEEDPEVAPASPEIDQELATPPPENDREDPPPTSVKDSEISDLDFFITTNVSGDESSNSAVERGSDKIRTTPIVIRATVSDSDDVSNEDSNLCVEEVSNVNKDNSIPKVDEMEKHSKKLNDVETAEKVDQGGTAEKVDSDMDETLSVEDVDEVLSVPDDDRESESDSVKLNVESTINQLKSLGASIEGSSVSDTYSSNEFTNSFKSNEDTVGEKANGKEADEKSNGESHRSAQDLENELDEVNDKTSEDERPSDEESRIISEIEKELQDLSNSTEHGKEIDKSDCKSDINSTRSSPMPELYIEPDLEGSKVDSDNGVDLEDWFNTINKENEILKSDEESERGEAPKLDSEAGDGAEEADKCGVDESEKEDEDTQSTTMTGDDAKLKSDHDIDLFEDAFSNDMPRLSPNEPDDKLVTNDVNLFEDPFDIEQPDVPSVSDNETEEEVAEEKSSEVDQEDIRLFEDPFEDERQEETALKESSLDNSGTTEEQEDRCSVSESILSEGLPPKLTKATAEPLDGDAAKNDKTLSPVKAVKKRRSVTKKGMPKKTGVIPTGFKCMHCPETSDHVLPLKIHLMREHPDANLTCIDLKAEYNRQRKYVQFCMLRQCDYYSLVTKDLVQHYEECPGHIIQDALAKSLSAKSKTERGPRKRVHLAPDPSPLSPSGSVEQPEPSEVGSDMTQDDDAESCTSTLSELTGSANVRRRKKINYNEGHLAGISDADLYEPTEKKRRKPGKRKGKDLSPDPATLNTLVAAAAPVPNLEPMPQGSPSLPATSDPSDNKKEKTSRKPNTQESASSSPQTSQSHSVPSQSSSKKEKSSSRKSVQGPEVIPTEFKWNLKCGHCLYHDKNVPNMKKHLMEKHSNFTKTFATDVYARHQRKKSQIYICLKPDCDFTTYRSELHVAHSKSNCSRLTLEEPPPHDPSFSEMNSSSADYSYMDSSSGNPESPSKSRHSRDIQHDILSIPDVHKCRYCDDFMVDVLSDAIIPQIQHHHKSHHPDETCLLINERNRLLHKPSRTFFCTEEGCTFFAATAAFLFAHQTGHEDPSMKDFINTESDVLATYDNVMDL